MLEKLGAKTEFSCEGHPTGFYIVFYAPITVAQNLVHCGFFNVELERYGTIAGGNKRHKRWSLRLGPHINAESERQTVLNFAANAWVQHFGPLAVLTNENTHASRRNNRQNRLPNGPYGRR